MIRGQACRLLAKIAAGFLIRILKEFSDGRGFSGKPGFSLELSCVSFGHTPAPLPRLMLATCVEVRAQGLPQVDTLQIQLWCGSPSCCYLVLEIADQVPG